MCRKYGLTILLSLLICLIGLGQAPQTPDKTNFKLAGLNKPVKIIKDRWGISHIFAQDQDDLFLAQGFNVASDRLFQLEMWRRQALGLTSEILGPKALLRDLGARLLKFRGELQEEANFYHPQGERIIASFVQGINAYIDITRKTPGLLPVEFKLLGITPGYWTPEVVVSRHNGLFRNVTNEVSLAQAVRIAGPEKIAGLLDLHPGNPDLRPAEGIDLGLIGQRILEMYDQTRSPVRFGPEDIAVQAASPAPQGLSSFPFLFWRPESQTSEGSNNWAVSGRLTQSGFPLLANDPHRALQVPSLRYWVHLHAPGWNVIGGGEPALPGVSIGHNEHGAWGLTIFPVDQEDLFVYETNPDNPNQYKYLGRWEDMKIIRETIPVKGEKPYEARLKFSRHGPVIFADDGNHKAYTLRAAWLEIGCAPYLACLRLDQARNWQEFREACFKNRTPSENMIWADRAGNIGWQATGLAPLRKNWPGLLPVPGDGRFEWSGFVPAAELPSSHNPSSGFVATANQDNLPEGYPYRLGYIWAEPFRFLRVSEVLSSGRKFGPSDMTLLQQDVLSIPARRLVPLLKDLRPQDARVRGALEALKGWDFNLTPESAAAAVYVAWQRSLLENLSNLVVPKEIQPFLPRESLTKAILWLQNPDNRFGQNAGPARDRLLLVSLEQAVESLSKMFGPDMARWQYGDEKFHHVRLQHPLADAVKEDVFRSLDLGPVPRGGNAQTVNSTSDNNNQTSGATFRIMADLADWDLSLGTNMPGQSGDPKSPHYSDLFRMWAEGRYFPVYFSLSKIQSAAEAIIFLEPAKR